MSFSITIGVDIAKKKFDVACLIEGKYKHKVFTNDEPGFIAFVAWFLSLCGDVKPLICMEATGAYSLPIADFLVNNSYAVSLVNPAKIHAFARSELSRAKTDKADAKLIARYAAIFQPPLWTPPPIAIRELQALIRRVEHLLEMIQMERNRLDTADKTIRTSIESILSALEAELKTTRKAIKNHIDNNPDLKQRSDLLASIPDIGDVAIAYLLVAMSTHHNFSSAKQVAAFAGLAPALRESGQWRGNTHIAKTGDAALRKALYMPALCAWRFNPLIRTFCERLKNNGKNGKAIACAAMRKLIHIAFGVLKSGKPFDPHYAV
ncbi:MAG: IS110 family transposase [Methylobacter sp.]|uniref:IS110 family transposase n=1 Tax=Candidatus Methylobacter titanis TaxID=3053457 RepID=A0AA43Q3C8_9GAMM|nr:IS110 family transposase [Candidatus Methylobacter titanis]